MRALPKTSARLVKTVRLQKAISFIHNSEDVEHQYSTVANSDDAWDTADWLIWFVWATPDYLYPTEEQSFIEELTRTYYCGSRYSTFYEFSLSGGLAGKTLVIAANRDKVITSATIR